MNQFAPPKEYLFDVEGKTFRDLEPELLDKVVVFLDIDDTLGICLLNIVENMESDTSNYDINMDKILQIKKNTKDIYEFEYCTYLNTNWIKVNIIFYFKCFLNELSEYLREKNIDIYLFSAAHPTYIECIKRILVIDYNFDIKGVCYATKDTRKINISCGDITIDTYYCAKDMYKELECYYSDVNNKIPILFDDREYWAANGFVVKIGSWTNHISDFLDNPIAKSNGLLI